MLRIELFQIESTSDIENNITKIKNFIKNSEGELLVFPELALTSYKADLFQFSQNFIQDFINKALSEIQKEIQEGQWVLLGAPFYKKDKIYNAIYLLSSQDIEVVAEKMLLFPGLDDIFTPGSKRKILEVKGIKLGIIICFELRSPEIARELIKEGVDLLIVPAQWPVSRIEHWKNLLKTRAIENKCYVIGVNSYGYSMGFGPRGEELSKKCSEKEKIKIDLELKEESIPYPLRTPYFKPFPNKVKTLEEVKILSEKRRKKGQTMVFTNGCFDILHAGHVDYLQKARKLGDFLVVGLNSDSSIKKIKGPLRPVNPETFRAQVLSALECVDYIIIFEEETPEKLIKELKPDILVKGADWEEEKIVGAKFVKSYGGKVVRIEFLYNISTSKIIEKIRSLKQENKKL